MIERYIQALTTVAPGLEEPAATRERLKNQFPAGAARRMTQLGMLMGSALAELNPTARDAVVYGSEFGESRALAAFLESFPDASPTLFQTSIHPSGVQQSLIGRQSSVPELFPFAGASNMVAHLLLTAALSEAPRALVCGGEERGTWLRELKVASERTFAFAFALEREATPATLARLTLQPSDEDAKPISLEAWFDLLDQKRAYTGAIGPGWNLELVWTSR